MLQQLCHGPVGEGWSDFLREESAQPYFAALDAFVSEAAAAATVYPPAERIFAAFAGPAAQVKVILLGQDPYHEEGQAMGLAFSVPQGTKTPPSLRNIQKELESDIGPGAGAGNDLTPWARQGVLLLNTVLTVEQGKANAHAGKGWEIFTRHAVEFAAAQGTGPLTAILWGKPAQKLRPALEAAAQNRPLLVVESAHPSPLSAYRGFFGSRPFSRVNEFLRQNGAEPVDWRLG